MEIYGFSNMLGILVYLNQTALEECLAKSYQHSNTFQACYWTYSHKHRGEERKSHAGDDVHRDGLLLRLEGDALHLLGLRL